MLAIAVVMIAGLLGIVLVRGLTTFRPLPIERFVMSDGRVHMGEVTRLDTYTPSEEVVAETSPDWISSARALLANNNGVSTRWLVRTGNFDVLGEHYTWVSDFQITDRSIPEWAVVFERLTWGRFYGIPTAFLEDGIRTAEGPEAAWNEFRSKHQEVVRLRSLRQDIEQKDIGRINHDIEEARLAVRARELELQKVLVRYGENSPEHLKSRERLEQEMIHSAQVDADATSQYEEIRSSIEELNSKNARYRIIMSISDGREIEVPLAEIVRGYPANRLGFFERISIYASRWFEFFTANPREANSEGGVFPAIFGTVVMTIIMSVLVVPFGVIAALYLREYAKAGRLVSIIRIAINNLAGVPSIVFGVFGLGFFSYFVGGTIDSIFFEAKLPSPTFGTGGILWSALTLALMTLPVVIVSTEEALQAVPGSMREGSYACGASKWQTIKRIVLPRALPGIMTGMILAMARGAGEVAPLMLVGAVKLAPDLPVDGYFPYVHLERSFMHLGFHIYDVGFQSQNSEAAIPMVFTTTLLLIAIIVVLNIMAIRLRSRFSRKFLTSQF
jgi:phosphate transport system permease protein